VRDALLDRFCMSGSVPPTMRPEARGPVGSEISESGSRFPSNGRTELSSTCSLPRPQRFHPHSLHNVNEILSPWASMVTVSSSSELQIRQRADGSLFIGLGSILTRGPADLYRPIALLTRQHQAVSV